MKELLIVIVSIFAIMFTYSTLIILNFGEFDGMTLALGAGITIFFGRRIWLYFEKKEKERKGEM